MDDDIDMDEWMQLSEQDQQTIIDREVAEHKRLLASLTFAQEIAHHRRGALESCMNWRKHIIRQYCPDLADNRLKAAQIRLLKLRTWRATGTYPGTA